MWSAISHCTKHLWQIRYCLWGTLLVIIPYHLPILQCYWLSDQLLKQRVVNEECFICTSTNRMLVWNHWKHTFISKLKPQRCFKILFISRRRCNQLEFKYPGCTPKNAGWLFWWGKVNDLYTLFSEMKWNLQTGYSNGRLVMPFSVSLTVIPSYSEGFVLDRLSQGI